jgi:hypothetical protein
MAFWSLAERQYATIATGGVGICIVYHYIVEELTKMDGFNRTQPSARVTRDKWSSR